MSSENAATAARSSTDCYAFLSSAGEIDCDSVGESPGVVRERMLKEFMGWRYKHPGRYPRGEKWEELKAFGSVVRVSISVVDA